MRTLLSLLLALIAFAGLGTGIWMLVVAIRMPHATSLDVVTALAIGSVPFLIGTVALGALAVVEAIGEASSEQLAATNRHTEAFLNEARHAPHHVAARQQ